MCNYFDMAKIEPNDLITPAQAARLREVSIQAIMSLISRGKLTPVEIAGQKFLRTSDVLSYQPSKGGRPPKQAKPTKGKAKK